MVEQVKLVRRGEGDKRSKVVARERYRIARESVARLQHAIPDLCEVDAGPIERAISVHVGLRHISNEGPQERPLIQSDKRVGVAVGAICSVAPPGAHY
jgi:hypothetical protein